MASFELASAMSGATGMESTVGVGSTFRFTILAERDVEWMSDSAEANELVQALGGRPVLVAVAHAELRASVVGQCDNGYAWIASLPKPEFRQGT